MSEKINKGLKIYLVVYFTILLINCSINKPMPTGEWDDYSLPIASFMNDCNFGITDEDLVKYKEIFPEWSEYIDTYSLSGYFTKNGTGEMPWYFPTYSFACMPMVLMLQLLDLPASYAFPYTNILCMVVATWVILRFLKVENKKKYILIFLLTINPIVFYISWTSAEVFIFSLLILTMTFWYNKWYKIAAICVSTAGMLNPTIMSIGLVMIVEYLFRIIKMKEKDTTWRSYAKEKILCITSYGCCYIVGLVPIIYNLYNTGHINLTASFDTYTKGKDTILDRFSAYLFDLNYGILPYFFLVFGMAVLMILAGIVKRNWRFLEWIGCFTINVMLYSIMTHINCGMSGIARYNAWGVVILLFALCMFYDEIINSQNIKKIVVGCIGINVVFTGIIIFIYGLNVASNTIYTQMTPIAEFVLEKNPLIYNPLHSTFYSRIANVDGGYNYLNELPVTYIAEDGYVRKVLASEDNKDELLLTYSSESGYSEWWERKVDSITGEGYLSVPGKYKIVKAPIYKLGETLMFCSNANNGREYVAKGLNNSEDWGSWTEGKEFELCFRTQSECEVIRAEVNCSVFNYEQKVEVFVNGISVYEEEAFKGGTLTFDFNNPGYMEVIKIKIVIPNALSPMELGYADRRILGLGIIEISFYDVVERMMYQLGETICFDSKDNNATRYISKGISAAEEWGAWTDEKEVEMQFSMESDSEKIHADVYCGVFNGAQDVVVYVNEQEIFRYDNFAGGVLQFDFNNPDDAELVKLKIVLPDAISPAELGYEDTRILGLGISKMVFTEAE